MNRFTVAARRLFASQPRDPRRRALRAPVSAVAETLDQRLMLSGHHDVEIIDGMELHSIPPPTPQDVEQMLQNETGNNGIGRGPFPYSETFQLHSLPGATKVIYLDFDGHVTDPATSWNNRVNPGQPIVTAPYDRNGDTSSFSNAELDAIQEIWLRVVEDFAHMNVDVTTEEPPLEDLRRSGGGDDRWGIRVAIGGSSFDWFGAGAGGVAFLTSFRSSLDTPTYVFTAQLANGNPKFTADAASHEVGHTLGLRHDGRTDGTEYHNGGGSGVTGWAPIMGVGYSKPVNHWSRGEYALANNMEDDLAIMTSATYGAGYRPDDYGSTLASATESAPPIIGGIQTFDIDGIIERTNDLDIFKIEAGAGTLNLIFTPDSIGPNLDIQARLLDEFGNEIAVNDRFGALDARLTVNIPQGVYYIEVDGVGHGDPLTGGYSDYGSLGQYNISGTAPEFIRGLIGGYVFNDLDGSGTQDLGEAGLPGRVVYIDANNNGFRDRRTTPDFGSGVLSLPIPDNRTVNSVINVINVPTEVVDVNVTVRLTHSFTPDLDIFLIGPDGTRVELVSDQGFLSNGFLGTTFDDAALNQIDDGSDPYTGSFRPLGSLAAFNGMMANGNWTLEVTDDASGNVGTLRGWTLDLTAGNNEAFTLTDATGYYEIDGLASGPYTIGTELPTGWEQTFPAGGAGQMFVLGDAEQKTDVHFGTRVGLSGAPLVQSDIFGRAGNGRIVTMESTGTTFRSRYAQDASWNGVLPVGMHYDNLITGDFNNDGIDDLAGLSALDGKWRVLVGSNSGFLAPQEWAAWSSAVDWAHQMTGDVNGDGLDDVIARSNSGSWIVGVSDGVRFHTSNFGAWSTNVFWQDVQTADVNGDGRTDIIGRASTGTWVAGVSNSGEFVNQVFGGWVTTVTWTSVLTADLNGDGMTDILGRASSGTWVGGISDGTQFINSVWGGWSTYVGWSQINTGDFDGDGRDDLVGLSSTGRIVVGLSDGVKFNFSIWTNWATTVTWTSVIGDFDGDGRDDIAGRASSGSWYVSLSQGSSFITQYWGGWTTSLEWDNIHSGVFV